MSSNNNITTTWQDQLKEAESLNIASRFAFRHSYKTCKWRIEIGILPSSEQRTEDDRLDEEERGVTMVQLPSIAAASCCRLLLAAGGAGCCWHCWSPAATPLTLLVATVMLLRWSSVVAGCFGAIFKLCLRSFFLVKNGVILVEKMELICAAFWDCFWWILHWFVLVVWGC